MPNNEKNLTSKTTAERLAGLLNAYYAKKTDVGVTSITAGSGINVNAASPNSAAAPEISVKLSAKSGNNLSLETGAGEEGLYFHQADAPAVSVVEKSAANAGYVKSYQVTVGGSAVGVDIDIPKDFLVKDAAIGTVAADDKRTGGKFEDDETFAEGDKYIDFTVNVQSGAAETDSHLYLNVKDLAHVYSAGAGIAVSASDEISVTVDATNARGLSAGANGLALALATPDTYTGGTKTAEGTAGAMSSADKYRLDHALLDSDLSDYSEAELRTLLGLPAAE